MHPYTKFILKVVGSLYLFLLGWYHLEVIHSWIDPGIEPLQLSLSEPAGQILMAFPLLIIEILIARWLIRTFWPAGMETIEGQVNRFRDLQIPTILPQIALGAGIAVLVLLPVGTVQASVELWQNKSHNYELILALALFALLAYIYYHLFVFPWKIDQKEQATDP